MKVISQAKALLDMEMYADEQLKKMANTVHLPSPLPKILELEARLAQATLANLANC